MMNIRNLHSKEGIGVKSKKDLCDELYLKLWFESDWYFCNITESGWFWKWLPRNKVPINHFLKSVWKRTVQKSIAELSTPNSIHHRNIQALTTEMFKVKNNIAPEIIKELFAPKVSSYELRDNNSFKRRRVNYVWHGTDNICPI